MSQEVLSLTLEFVGTLLIGLSVLRVHMQLWRDHKIDKRVLRDIQKERGWTILGIILITLGFGLNFV